MFARSLSDESDGVVATPLLQASPPVLDLLARLGGDSDHDGDGDRVMMITDGPAEAAQTKMQTSSKSSKSKHSHLGRCGKGRWGNMQERRLISSLMHQGKLRKLNKRINAEQCEHVMQVVEATRLRGKCRRMMAKLLPKKWSHMKSFKATLLQRRKRGATWMSPLDVLEVGFGHDSFRRCSALAPVFGSSTDHIRTLKVYDADCFLAAQMRCLGWLCKLCSTNPPSIAMRRLAWDETGEKLTLSFGTEHGNAEQQRSTWQVMVCRIRLILVWLGKDGAAPTVVDWTLVVPPTIVRTPSAAQIYYALFQAPMTKPLMMACFLIMQRAEIAMDLSETDDASANTKLEMHILAKAMGLSSQGM